MSETAPKTLAQLTDWPTTKDGMSADLMMRIISSDTQREYLRKWAAIDCDKAHFASPLYHAQTLSIISGVGLLACLWALREADPAKADEFAQDYWAMCDAGDSFGELLWEFAERAGLDLSLVEEALAANAVDPVAQLPGTLSTRD